MNPGSVFFDEEFAFHDGETGEKLFIFLGSIRGISVVAKTTSKQHGRGLSYGCQPGDRFHNFYLPPGSCYLRGSTWVCLDEFYKLASAKVLQKKFTGTIKHVCDLNEGLIREIQECAMMSQDITNAQSQIVSACRVA